MDDEWEISEDEARHIEELELFSRAGIKACVFYRIDGASCSGEIQTVGKTVDITTPDGHPIHEIRMNVCEYHHDNDLGFKVMLDEMDE